MTLKPRFFWVLLVISMLILAACGGGEDDGEPSPTPPTIGNASPSPIPGVNTPTPLPTIGGQPPAATATRFNIPTAVAIQPTSLGIPATLALTNAIAINTPTSNSQVRGAITITGSASHPNFVQYALEYGPEPNPSNLWYPITTVPINTVVLNNVLGAWNTTTIPDGNYQMRLHVWLNNGLEEFRVVNNLQVQNSQPTPRANNNPLIAPIAPVMLTRGNSVTLALAMSDIDNDPLTYIAQVGNPSIATVTPAGSTAITVNGIAAGTTTVTLSISDQRGGSASTTFNVTVNAPATANNPPAVAPIPSQTINTGATATVNIVATDPDQGDTVTLEAVSSTPGVASVALSNAVLTITGNSQGSASITVTARDSRGLVTTTSFLITVITPAPANQPPTIAAIGNQTVTAGATQDVTLNATDPNNDPLTITAASSNNGVVTAQLVNNTTIRLQGVAAGTGSITISASDNKGGTATTSFNVTVNAPVVVDNPPTITAIGNQTVLVGASVEVTVNATDPEGKTVTITAEAVPTGIATVTVNGNKLNITGASAGTTQVTVTANDGTKVGATTFQVDVTSPQNTPPSLTAIGDQTLDEGTEITVPVIATDPDGDTVTISASADDSSIASVTVNGTNLTVRGEAVGITAITVVANDGEDDSQPVSFNVTVSAVVAANTAPVVAPIDNQATDEGTPLTVNVNATDNESASLTINATSDNPEVNVAVAGSQLTITNVSPITADLNATITVTATDEGSLTSQPVTFGVTIRNLAEPNTAPTINNADPASLSGLVPGDVRDVTINASDPESNPITLSAVSDNEAAATVQVVSGSQISITAVGGGNATINVTASDDKGLTSNLVPISVEIIAPAPNTPPTVQTVGDQTVEETHDLPVEIVGTDADGDPVSVTGVNSSDTNIATVSNAGNSLTVTGVAPGNATITVDFTDGTDSGQTTFNVNVTAIPSTPFDINTIDEIPSQDSLERFRDVFNVSGNPNWNFAVVGDESVADANFLPAPSSFTNTGGLQATIDFYMVDEFGAPRDDNTHPFVWVSDAAGAGFTVNSVFESSSSGTCTGLNHLQCELQTNNPMILIISFTPTNATRVGLDEFGNQLRAIINTALLDGAIPVVTTLPDDNTVDDAVLAQYNERIVTIASDSSSPAVIWNLYKTMQGADVYGVGGGGAGDLNDGAGWNRRNRAALQVLEAIRTKFF